MADGKSDTRRAQREAPIFTIWEEVPPPRPAVTRGRIVEQAVSLLDEVGYDGLTMRRLAERLGIQAASLYNHVPDKLTLLALVADAVCGEVREPGTDRPWRAQLAALAADYRRVLLAHRDAARVLLATPPVGPNRLRLIERTLSALRSAGFPDDVVADAAVAFNVYVTGFVLDETRGRAGGAGEDLSEAEAAQFARWWRSLPAARYPTLAALAERMLGGDADRRYAFGLGALLDGLERHLRRRPAEPRSARGAGRPPSRRR